MYRLWLSLNVKILVALLLLPAALLAQSRQHIADSIRHVAQSVPKEDCIVTPNGLLTMIDGVGMGDLGSGYLYFNDSCVILHFTKKKGQDVFYRIKKKAYDSKEHYVLISCLDSAQIAKSDFNSTPAMIVTIEYFDGNYQRKKNPDVTCLFYYTNRRLSLGSSATSDLKKVLFVRRYWSKYIIG